MRAAGFTPDSVTVAGGATRSELWLQIHADVSNVPFILTKARGGGEVGWCGAPWGCLAHECWPRRSPASPQMLAVLTFADA